jgi:ferredoxin
MPDTRRLAIGDVIVEIDRDLCVGFGDCVTEAPDVFELDAEDVAVFRDGSADASRESILRACEICPVDALVAFDAADGSRLAP